jgi:hypothetical protein
MRKDNFLGVLIVDLVIFVRASLETPDFSFAQLPSERAETLILSLAVKNCPEYC